jgi:tetratricopeptide (TPR) repeat protein
MSPLNRSNPLRWLPVVAASLLCTGVFAQTLRDPALEALYLAEKADELQRAAAPRVAAQPDDAQAVLGLALASLMRDDAAARRGAIERAQACVEKQPRAAPCQYALGVVLGLQAASEGMFKMARSAGTVRDALTAAYEIDPTWYPARSSLIEFHVLAPGVMGGSTAKAAELARSAPRPEQVRALEARMAMGERKFELAVQGFMALPAGLEPALASDVLAWGVQAGLGMVNAGQAAKAQPYFERLLREQPRQAGPAYGLARVRGEAGAHEEALKLYEQAAGLKGAADWPILYRIGMAQQQLGRVDAAKVSYTRFIAAGKGQKSSLEDAKKRLEQLGS